MLSGWDVVEAGHPERDHRPAHPFGPHIAIVDDNPRVLTDLPQVLPADDLVRRAFLRKDAMDTYAGQPAARSIGPRGWLQKPCSLQPLESKTSMAPVVQ
jgi:hypothetical protein